MSTYTQPTPKSSGVSDKKILGCFGIGCLSIIGLVVAIVFGIYYTIFHTAVPARWMASAISTPGKLEIEGITGSLSEGFRIETIRVDLDGGQMSVLKGVAFKYESGFGDDVIINEVAVESADLYVNANFKHNSESIEGAAAEEAGDEVGEEAEEEEEDDEYASGSGSSSGQSVSMTEIRNAIPYFEVKKVSITKFNFNVPEEEFTFSLEQFLLDDFKIENGTVSLAQLLMNSDVFDMSLVPDASEPGKMALALEAKPGIDEKLIKPIDARGEIYLNNEKVWELEAFGGALRYSVEEVGEPEKTVTMTLSGLALADYLDVGFPPGNLSGTVTASGDESAALADGRYAIGDQTFTFPDAEVRLRSNSDSEGEIVLESEDAGAESAGTFTSDVLELDGTAFRVEITLNEDSALPDIQLKSEPEMEKKEILSRLLHGSGFEELGAAEKTAIQASSWVE